MPSVDAAADLHALHSYLNQCRLHHETWYCLACSTVWITRVYTFRVVLSDPCLTSQAHQTFYNLFLQLVLAQGSPSEKAFSRNLFFVTTCCLCSTWRSQTRTMTRPSPRRRSSRRVGRASSGSPSLMLRPRNDSRAGWTSKRARAVKRRYQIDTINHHWLLPGQSRFVPLHLLSLQVCYSLATFVF